MNMLLIVLVVVAVLLLITGGLVGTLKFLLWVGLVLVIIAVVMFLYRRITGRKA